MQSGSIVLLMTYEFYSGVDLFYWRVGVWHPCSKTLKLGTWGSRGIFGKVSIIKKSLNRVWRAEHGYFGHFSVLNIFHVSLSRDIIRVLAYTAPVPRCRQKKIKTRTKVTVHFSPWWQSVEEPTTKQGLPCAAFTGSYWCTYSTAQQQLFVLLRKAVGQGPAGEDGKPWTFHSLWWTTAVMTVFMLHKGQKARAANQKTGGWKGLNDELCTSGSWYKVNISYLLLYGTKSKTLNCETLWQERKINCVRVWDLN